MIANLCRAENLSSDTAPLSHFTDENTEPPDGFAGATPWRIDRLVDDGGDGRHDLPWRKGLRDHDAAGASRAELSASFPTFLVCPNIGVRIGNKIGNTIDIHLPVRKTFLYI